MEELKLLAMTLVLAVLIWATADSLVNETASLPIQITVIPEPGNPDLVVTADDKQQSFRLQVVGPRKVIAQAQAAAPVAARLRISDRPTGSSTIPLKAALEEQWKQFPKLNIQSVDPPKLGVFVDHKVSREVTVALKEQLVLTYDIRPQLNRASVTLTLLESQFEELARSGKAMHLEIDPERPLEDQTPGKRVEVQIPLVPADLGFPENAVFTPSTLAINAKLKAGRITREISTVPILLAVSFANFGKPVVAVPPDGGILVTRAITVTGPAHQIERLMHAERPVGIIRLKEEHLDKLGTQQSFMPEILLPNGILLAKPPEPIILTLQLASDS